MPKPGTPPVVVDGHLTERDGRQMAIDMLRDFRNASHPAGGGYSDRALQADLRTPGAAQDIEPLRRWLDTYLCAPAVVRDGFLAVLSSLLDDWASDAVMDVDTLEKIALEEVAQ